MAFASSAGQDVLHRRGMPSAAASCRDATRVQCSGDVANLHHARRADSIDNWPYVLCPLIRLGGAIIGVTLLLYMIDRLGLRDGLFAAGASSALVLLPLIAIVLRYRGPADLGLERDGAPPGTNRPTFDAAPCHAAQGSRRAVFWTATAGLALGLLVQNGFIAHHVALSAVD